MEFWTLSSDFLFSFLLESWCPFPPSIANGKHNGLALQMFTFEMSVTYSCEPGYLLIGKASIFCGPSGNWSLPVPSCKGNKDCNVYCLSWHGLSLLYIAPTCLFLQFIVFQAHIWNHLELWEKTLSFNSPGIVGRQLPWSDWEQTALK